MAFLEMTQNGIVEKYRNPNQNNKIDIRISLERRIAFLFWASFLYLTIQISEAWLWKLIIKTLEIK